jgi:hypothetical protein
MRVLQGFINADGYSGHLHVPFLVGVNIDN